MKEKNPMQTWAKRGLQTALVTGGLLMLGTGIASADENVNPDTPASPLDLNATVPIDTSDNAIGTPLGQYDVPAMKTELSTKPIAPVAKDVFATAKSPAGTSDLTNGLPKAAGPGQFTPTRDALKGNKVSGDLVAPIQVVDNAVGVIGDAHVDGTSQEQNWAHNQDIATSGKDSGLAGNVVALDWAMPVQLAGNGAGVAGGSGAVRGGSADQSTSETGNIDTSGQGSGLSGNVVAGQFATPVQVTGNAISYLLGNAYSSYAADTSAASGGSMLSNGKGSSDSGNVVGAPIALPVKFNGNAGGMWGSDADTASNSSADAKAGDKRPGSLSGTPTYLETDGNNSFLAGNAAAAQLSPVADVADVAASWIGNTTTGKALDRGNTVGTTSSTVDSGGFVKTTGENAAGAGNVVDPAVALPIDACGIGGTYLGNSHAACGNTVDANAGNGSYTRGNGGFLGGNVVNTQSAGAPEVYGIGASHIGNASGTANEDKKVTAGGYDGSQGNDSSGSGNILQVPLGVPAEAFGVGGSFLGQSSAEAHETKVVRAGGGGSAVDDNGFLSSNMGTVPASVPAQLFGIGGAVLGQGHGKASSDTTSGAGSDVHTSGPNGTGAGNVLEAPVSLPVQGHSIGGALGGIGTGWADNLTDSKAGGDATTDGKDGAITGDIVKAPVAGAATIFGDGIAGAALGHGGGTNDITSAAGGDSGTNGEGGTIAGDIVGADPLPVAQVFSDAVSAAGAASGERTNSTVLQDSGDDTTSGVEGAISGDILDLPVTAVPYVGDDAIAAAGLSHAVGDNRITAINGGTPTTDGHGSALSGYDFYRYLPVTAPVYGIPRALLGTATSEGTDSTEMREPSLDAPAGKELAATRLPALPHLSQGLPVLPHLSQGLPVLPHLSRGLPALAVDSALPQLPAMSMLPLPGAARGDVPQISGLSAPEHLQQLKGAGSLPSVTGLGNGLHAPALPGLAGVPALPGTTGRSDASILPQLPTPLPVKASLPVNQLPAVTASSALPGVPGVPTTMPVQASTGLPALAALPALPGAPARSTAALPTAALPTAGLPTAALPAAGLPALPTAALPVLPGVPARSTAALPPLPTAALPARPTTALPTTALPTAALPVRPTAALPTAALPTAARSTAGLPTPPTAHVPAVADMGSSPLGAIRKLAAKVTGFFKK